MDSLKPKQPSTIPNGLPVQQVFPKLPAFETPHGTGVPDSYKEAAQTGGNVMWRAKVKGRTELADNIPLHVSLKTFDKPEDMPIDEIHQKAKELNIQRPDPRKLKFDATTHTSPRTGETYYMLKLHNHDPAHEAFSNHFNGRGITHPKFMQHITIDKELHDQIKKEGIKPGDVEFSPLMIERGANNPTHLIPDAQSHNDAKSDITPKLNPLKKSEDFLELTKSKNDEHGATNGLHPSDVMSAYTHVSDNYKEHPKLLHQIKNNKPKKVSISEAKKYRVKHNNPLDKEPNVDKPSDFTPELKAKMMANPIVVAHAKGKHFVLDGQHRLAQAIKDGHTHISVIHANVPELHDELHNHFPKKTDMKKSEWYDLEKGGKGDWQKEGYALHYHNDGKGKIFIRASHPTNNEAGYAKIYDNKDSLSANEVAVHPEHRRKGLATAMYKLAENKTGLKIHPGSQKPDGKALWNQKDRPFGKSEPLEIMEKGEKGDYKKEGITLHYSKAFNDKHLSSPHLQVHNIHALGEVHDESKHGPHTWLKDANGVKRHVVGEASYRLRHASDSALKADIKVHKDFRRKGIATAMNKLAEEKTGKKISHADLSEDGRKLAGAKLGKSESLEVLEKGSLQSRTRSDPRGALSGPHQTAMSTWQGTPSADRSENREKLPKMEGNLRERALHKLSGQTKTKLIGNKRHFLLHRGMSPEEHSSSVKSGVINHPSQHSSWTPRQNLANNFANPYIKSPGKVVSAWVHEDNIHTIPKQFGAVDNEYAAASGQKSNRMANEHEVIVRPNHSSKIERDQVAERPTSRMGDRIHDAPVNTHDAINIKGSKEQKIRSKNAHPDDIRNMVHQSNRDIMENQAKNKLGKSEWYDLEVLAKAEDEKPKQYNVTFKDHKPAQSRSGGYDQYHFTKEHLHHILHHPDASNWEARSNMSAGKTKEGYHPTAIVRKTPPVPIRDYVKKHPAQGSGKKILYHGVGKDTAGAEHLSHGGKHTVHTYDPYHANPETRKLPNDQYDEVHSHYTLNVVPHHVGHQILREMHDRLKPGGKAVVSVRRDLPKLHKSESMQPLEKSAMKRFGVAAAAMGALSGAPNMAQTPQPSNQEMSNQQAKQYSTHRMLNAMRQVETSGGKNLNHPTASNGQTAIGQYALMPDTIRDTVKMNPDLKRHHPRVISLQGKDMAHYLQDNPDLEQQIAERHLHRLEHHFGGDPAKLGYAWLNGIVGSNRDFKRGIDPNTHWHASKVVKAYKQGK